MVLAALYDHADWNAALDRRGVVDRSLVQIDPWPAGTFGLGHEEGRRITRCLAYLRDNKEDNGYARPLEGLIAFVDMGRAEVLEVLDLGVVPLPSEHGSYYPEHNGPLRTDLKPLEIIQPEGPSFEVDGNLVRWQKWSLRIGMDPLEGLVLWTIGYEDGGRIRPIVYRASVSEMVVPYGHPGPMHAWKSAFDAGEWGLGRMANSLTLGCDCLGEIRYFDDVFADERGKHTHGRTPSACTRRTTASSGSTSTWSRAHRGTAITSAGGELHRHGGQLRVRLLLVLLSRWHHAARSEATGIMSTMAVADGDPGDHASMIAPGLAAPFHQHLFNVRLDMQVDGSDNEVTKSMRCPRVGGGPPRTHGGNAFGTTATLLESELDGRRDVDSSRSRVWRIANRSHHNRLGQPTAYKLLPGATARLLADPSSSVGRRAAFESHNLWVTPFDPEERRAAGDYPNQHHGHAGLPTWTAEDRPIVDTDIVLWHSFGVTHIPRPEDWPVMPVEYTGFTLLPFGFFDRNPALDVPPSSDHCHV